MAAGAATIQADNAKKMIDLIAEVPLEKQAEVVRYLECLLAGSRIAASESQNHS